MNELRTTTQSPEVVRMACVAITEAQTAQMWAVKAITWKD
jgi:phosphoribosylcarboxyaminoimidazole (NCAIR) mutase